MPRPSPSRGGGARPERRSSGRKPQVRWLGRAYQGALEAALALAIAVLAGAWVDDRFETAPIGVIVGLATLKSSLINELNDLSNAINAIS